MDQKDFDTSREGNCILADASIDGDVRADKSVCLEGTVRGDVRTSGSLAVREGALVGGDVDCRELYLSGKVAGNVRAVRRAVMSAGAVIEGCLETGCLEITPGARIAKGLRLTKDGNK